MAECNVEDISRSTSCPYMDKQGHENNRTINVLTNDSSHELCKRPVSHASPSKLHSVQPAEISEESITRDNHLVLNGKKSYHDSCSKSSNILHPCHNMSTDLPTDKKVNGVIQTDAAVCDSQIHEKLPVSHEAVSLGNKYTDSMGVLDDNITKQNKLSNCEVSSRVEEETRNLACLSLENQCDGKNNIEVVSSKQTVSDSQPDDVHACKKSSCDITEIDSSISSPCIEYIVYESEKQMPDIMRLITKDLSEPYSIYTYRYFIHNWPKLCFLAKADDKCVGAIVCKLDLHKKMTRRGYIAMLAVDSEYRRRQIGSTLVTKAIEAMIRDDCDEVVLETEITNQGALHLYENLGFVRDKRLFRYYLNGVDALRLKLWLR